jgi:thiamine biosynthesis lipoprotein
MIKNMKYPAPFFSRYAFFLLSVLMGLVPTTFAKEPDRYVFTEIEMAMPVRVILYSEDADQAEEAAELVFDRFEALNQILSDYDSDSEIRRACRTAGTGEWFAMSDDLWTILRQSREFTEKTGGAFDPTVGPVITLWRRSRRLRELPPPERLEKAAALVGNELWKLNADERSVEFSVDRMRLDLGGIAKGFAIDQACEILRQQGLECFLVDAGGDLRVGRAPPGETGWVVGIAPLEKDAPPQCYLLVENAAVASSGDTWQYVEIEGVRYSHIVDPRTGMALTERRLVTVLASDATTADVLASAVSVLGARKGIAMVENWNSENEEPPEIAVTISQKKDGTWTHIHSPEWTSLRRLSDEQIVRKKKEKARKKRPCSPQ